MNQASCAPQEPGKRGSPLLHGLSYVFLLLGMLALGYSGYIVAGAQAYQAIEIRRFEQTKPSTQLRPVMQGDVIGRIQIPRLRLEAIVVQGDSPDILRRGVGHIPQTALPGEPGNIALAGHRDSFFRPLRTIQAGDLITFETPHGTFQYQVEFTHVVQPADVRVLQPSNTRELTLITCFPFNYVGSAPNRFIVRAREVDYLPR
jgi:sortase A